MFSRINFCMLAGAALGLAPVQTILANSAPVVSNVTARQRTDGSMRVDIRYNLADADGDACTIAVLVSNDAGATWTVPANALTGAVGSGVMPGLGKLIVWDCWPDLGGAFGNQYAVLVCADDGPNPIPPGTVLIPAGEFQMGDTFNEGHSSERPVHAVYLDAFFMDRYEVTNQQYAEALNWAKAQGLIAVTSGVVCKAGSGTSYPYCDTTASSSYSRITWDGSVFGVVPGNENDPVAKLSWYGSVACANWRSAMQGRPLCYDLSTWNCDFNATGYRLPTEAEWEKAARGAVAGHRFPWSDTDTIQHGRANYYSSASYSYDTSPTRGYHPDYHDGGYPYTSPVGSFAPNGYGLYDMAGNLCEWCNDWANGSYYSSSPYSNPRGPASTGTRINRGGAWGYNAYRLRSAFRWVYNTPADRETDFGFRLALDFDEGGAMSDVFLIDNRQGPPPPNLDLEVKEVRVAQVLEDDTLPLIADRPTLVRVAVKWAGPNTQVAGVDAVLRVYVNGSLWRGPDRSTGAITARSPVNWTQEQSTICFVISPPESPDVDLDIELNPASPGEKRIEELDYANNPYRRNDLSFECRRTPTIAYVPIDYRPTAPNPDEPNLPDADMIAAGSGDAFVRGIYPIPSLEYYETDSEEWAEDLNEDDHAATYLNDLEVLRQGLNPVPDFLYAWLPGNPYAGNGRAGGIPSRVAFGNTELVRYQRTFAHELGHDFGLSHKVATLGSLGVDVENLLGLGVIKPSMLSDIMVAGLLTHQAWVDADSYTSFANDAVLTCPGAAMARLTGEGDVLLVCGRLDPVLGTATVDHVYELPPRPLTEANAAGNLILRAYHLDPAPTLLYELQFLAEAVDCPEGIACAAAFAPIVPAAAGAPVQRVDRIDIVDVASSQVLAQQLRSSSAPQIAITNPTEGQHLIEAMEITWTGSDGDGDSLYYTLSYSWNDGLSWIPLIVNTTETSFRLNDGSAVPGSSAGTARLKLTATDGMNTVSTEVTGLTWDVKKPPRVHVLSPTDGATSQEGAPLSLSASARDPEDGETPDAQIQWASDVDGVIGIGRSMVVNSLSLGTHQLSVTAVDSDGMSSAASVTAEVTKRMGAVPSDFDHDGDVDAEDMGLFRLCRSGPAIPLLAGCERRDFDKDNDVDQTDFAIFQRCYSGQDNPADPACAG